MADSGLGSLGDLSNPTIVSDGASLILNGIVLGETVGWGIMGALILIALGISYLVRGFFRGG